MRHPDLVGIARQLRNDLEETLEAEQYAALTAARRRLTLRDRLLEAEDRELQAVISSADGQLYTGVVVAVGADHVVLEGEARARWLALDHIVMVEVH